MKRWYDLVNLPWVHGPRWRRARRYSKAVAKRMHAEHVAWAQALSKKEDRECGF